MVLSELIVLNPYWQRWDFPIFLLTHHTPPFVSSLSFYHTDYNIWHPVVYVRNKTLDKFPIIFGPVLPFCLIPAKQPPLEFWVLNSPKYWRNYFCFPVKKLVVYLFVSASFKQLGHLQTISSHQSKNLDQMCID